MRQTAIVAFCGPAITSARQKISAGHGISSKISKLPGSPLSLAASPPLAMSSMSYQGELSAAKKAVIVAARLCQNVQKELLKSDVHSKPDESPVTVADYGSQALVSFILERQLHCQSLSLTAEEDSTGLHDEDAHETLERIAELVNNTLASDDVYFSFHLSTKDILAFIDRGKSEAGRCGRHWVLDPIDGTKGFVRGDQYAVALALLDEGKVVLGVLACPNLPLSLEFNEGSQLPCTETGCIFFAESGGGAHMQPLDCSSPPLKVHVSAVENLEEASFFESYEAAHSSHALSGIIAKKLGVKAPPVRMDSQVKYGALSRGDGAIFLRFPRRGYREKIWDHAAGYIIVTEAGGVVYDAAGDPLDFSKGKFLDLKSGIVATNPKLMPFVIKAVQEALSESAPSL